MARMLERYYDMLTKHLPAGQDIPAIDITGAARWFLEESEKAYWDFSEDFPVVVPPFSFTWLEYIPPKTINENGIHRPMPREVETLGCMAIALPVKDEYQQEVIRHDALREFIVDAGRKAGRTVKSLNDDAERDRRIQSALIAGHRAKWIVILKPYMESKQRIVDVFTFFAYLDPQGRIIPELFVYAGLGRMAEVANEGGAIMFPFLFALSLMHAKNVSLEDIPLPSAVAKKRQRRGLSPVQYKTLHIRPMQQAAAAASKNGQGSIKTAMHLCRGHFKDFRQGKGLFGRYKGLYWWDMHVRGDKEHGQVIKDYEVSP